MAVLGTMVGVVVEEGPVVLVGDWAREVDMTSNRQKNVLRNVMGEPGCCLDIIIRSADGTLKDVEITRPRCNKVDFPRSGTERELI